MADWGGHQLLIHLLILSTKYLLSIEWNLIRLGSPAHEMVTKTVHKTLPQCAGDVGV